MTTFITDESVLYTVIDGDADINGYDPDCLEVWRKEVPFGKTEAFRAGGARFVEAAREQAEVAEQQAQRNRA